MHNSQSKFASVFEKLDLKTAIRDIWWGERANIWGAVPKFGLMGGAPPCPPLRETLPCVWR